MEAVLVVVAVAALLPWFDRVAADDAGRDRRFAEGIVEVRGLPNPVLPLLCASHGGLAEPLVRERLCRRTDSAAAAADLDRMPCRWPMRARAPATRFSRRSRTRKRAARSFACSSAKAWATCSSSSNAIEATDAELQPFVNRYALDGPDGAGPMPLECAFEIVERSLARADTRATSAPRDMARANALLLLGAALDGHPATRGAGRRRHAAGRVGAGQRPMRRGPPGRCAGAGVGADGRGPAGAGDRGQERSDARAPAFGGLAVGRLDAGRFRLAASCPALHPARASASRWRSPPGRSRRGSAGFRGRWPAIAPSCPARDGAWWLAMPAPFVLWLLALRRRRAGCVGVAAQVAAGRTADDGLARRAIPASC